MPEGDTVRKLAAALAPALAGCRLRDLYVKRLDAKPLIGRRVTAVRSRGKHLYFEFDSGAILRSHLGLYGSWHSYGIGEVWQKPRRQAWIVAETERRQFVCFNAKEVEILRKGGFRLVDQVNRLGPDLTGSGLDLEQVRTRAGELVAPATLLVDLLLDQRVAAGIGNVYKSEVLFLERQNPLRPYSTLTPQSVRALYGRAAGLLRRNLGGGPRVTRFVPDGRGELWVYGRAGLPCLACGETVRCDRFGVIPRSTFWCPGCQPPMPAGSPAD